MNSSSSDASFPPVASAQHNSWSSPTGMVMTDNAGSSSMQPGLADLAARRSISDSVLSRGARTSYNRMNTVNMMVNRSGGPAVKKMIEVINERCAQQEAQQQSTTPVEAPEEEVCVLAQWAVDSYYKVVIAGREGIPAIIRAMRVFPAHRGLQECCCLALGNLCSGGGGNLLTVENNGGLAAVVAAMRNHPQSVAVQTAACDALRNMSQLILVHANNPSSPLGPQLIERLSHAKEMYLLPMHRSIAETLLRAVLATTPRDVTY